MKLAPECYRNRRCVYFTAIRADPRGSHAADRSKFVMPAPPAARRVIGIPQIEQRLRVVPVNCQDQIVLSERKRLRLTGDACHCRCDRQSRRHDGPFNDVESHIDASLIEMMMNARFFSSMAVCAFLARHLLSSVLIRERGPEPGFHALFISFRCYRDIRSLFEAR